MKRTEGTAVKKTAKTAKATTVNPQTIPDGLIKISDLFGFLHATLGNIAGACMAIQNEHGDDKEAVGACMSFYSGAKKLADTIMCSLVRASEEQNGANSKDSNKKESEVM